MSKIFINGVTIEGNDLRITESGVYVDGIKTSIDISQSRVVDVHIVEGTLMNLSAEGSVTAGSVKGSVTASGSVTCDCVGGSVNAQGSVKCGRVGGSITAMGNVRHA